MESYDQKIKSPQNVLGFENLMCEYLHDAEFTSLEPYSEYFRILQGRYDQIGTCLKTETQEI